MEINQVEGQLEYTGDLTVLGDVLAGAKLDVTGDLIIKGNVHPGARITQKIVNKDIIEIGVTIDGNIGDKVHVWAEGYLECNNIGKEANLDAYNIKANSVGANSSLTAIMHIEVKEAASGARLNASFVEVNKAETGAIITADCHIYADNLETGVTLIAGECIAIGGDQAKDKMLEEQKAIETRFAKLISDKKLHPPTIKVR